LKGAKYVRPGGVLNPFFMRADAPFRHPQFPIYLVTRLAAYDANAVKAMIDRAQAARNRGQFVVDLKSGSEDAGDGWLRSAAAQLPKDRLVLDESQRVLYDQKNVIAYAA